LPKNILVSGLLKQLLKTDLFMENRILFEDNHLLVFNKSAGEIVQGDKTGDVSLLDTLKTFLKDKYNKPGNVFLGLIHRLDRPVSGVIVFAKTGKALSRMNKLFKEKNIKKTYLAIVSKPPPENEGSLRNYLSRNRTQNKSYVKKSPGKDVKEAVLRYKLVGASKSFYLIEVELETGRHHQIRAQLANIGCPVKGDLKYGYPRSNPNGGIDLHAAKIEFVHPVNQKQICVEAAFPDDDTWEYFL
jgi:23S rRNA pseudouridine1911/1915/1917 synthase